MNDLLLLAAQNTLVACVLAVLVFGLSRAVRNPPLAHALWLLVLFKLVSPPLVGVDWRMPQPSEPRLAELDTAAPQPHRWEPPRSAQQAAKVDPSNDDFTNDDQRAAVKPVATTAIAGKPTERPTRTPTAAVDDQPFWTRVAPVIFWCWFGGAVVCALSAGARIVRFQRALREMLPAPAAVERLVHELAGKLGARRVPSVRCAQSVEVPFLWCLVRPTIVLPMRLTRELDGRQIGMVLAHELAHLRRRDPWVRLFELGVAIVHWWNPLVWFVRRELHGAEDLCCDAWVRWAFPDGRKTYAEVVLKAAESLAASHVARKLLPASPFLRSVSLKERIEMILESRFRPRVSLPSTLVIAFVAAIVLPTFVRFTPAEAAEDKEKTTPAAKTETAASEFPFTVKFEQGATRFLEGDKITIVEIRGTAETFKPGDIDWIKGTYSLASHERATLAAYTTAKNAADGRSRSFTAQTTTIKKGNGTFTLFLPMACEGWPHVSFYSAEGGEDFGGNYFGTGESVLKRWWRSKEAEAPAKDDKPTKQGQSSRGVRRAFGRVTDVDGRPLAGVEVRALCGGPTPRRAGIVTSGEDGRYELEFVPGLGRTRGNQPLVESTLISARRAGYFEENLNRQGRCAAASALPDEAQLKFWGVSEDRVCLTDRPLEINFVMRPAVRAAGRLVDEQGQPLVKYSVSLRGPDLPPGSEVVSNDYTDEQGRFVLDEIPTTFRYQFHVRKADPKPPWNDSWASAALKFDQPESGDLRAWFGDREIRVQEFVLRVAGEGVHQRTAILLAGNSGMLNITSSEAAGVKQSDARLVAKSAVLTLTNATSPDASQSLIKESLPAAAARGFPTHLARGRPNESGEFVISFENPPGFELVRGKHQVIFQVFISTSQQPIREKIFRQLDIEEGRDEVPVTIARELIDDSRVSITFVTIQPEHEAWVKAFFHEGKGTKYRGIWTSDGDILPAIPFAAVREG